ESGDGRLAFFLTPADRTNPSPYNLPIDDLKGFFDTPTKTIPVYLPGEMNLIKAEALVRQNRLAEAVVEINAVRTKTTDPFGVAAALSIYSGPVTESGCTSKTAAAWDGLVHSMPMPSAIATSIRIPIKNA
ncbi:MAG: hypothetical protein DYG95_15560, partial [Chlorobi bacterium CHB1]|nr:hypothetical protein [Chlorobi bacterium CHB1]